jgi:hypothetical protein
MILGAALMIPAYLLLGLTGVVPAVPMLILGSAFVLLPAALWPSVPLLVDHRRLGTAYGLMTLVQNVGLMLFPYLNGMLRERTAGYGSSMMMFAGLGTAALVFAVLLKRADSSRGGVLARP